MVQQGVDGGMDGTETAKRLDGMNGRDHFGLQLRCSLDVIRVLISECTLLQERRVCMFSIGLPFGDALSSPVLWHVQ